MRSLKYLAFTGLLGALVSSQAFAQLNNNGFNGGFSFSPNDDWSIQALMPSYISPTIGTGTPSNYGSAFAAWKATAQGAGWNIVINNTSGVSFTMLDYVGTINNLGEGDLVSEIGYNKGAGNINPGPNPIGANGSIFYDTTAAWTQSVTTNVPRLPGQPTTGYLDLAAGPYRAPLYPYQYQGSSFWDDPSRSGNEVSAVTWVGDAFITTLNRNTKTLTFFGGVEWGFTITYQGVPGAPNPPFEANDIGNIPQGVAEPAPTAILGLGLVGLLIRRKRRS